MTPGSDIAEMGSGSESREGGGAETAGEGEAKAEGGGLGNTAEN